MSQRRPLFPTNNLWLKNTQDWMILLTFFSLPLSKSAPLIFISLLTILWLFFLSKEKILRLKNNRLSTFLIILYIIHPISLIWSDDIRFGIQRSLDYIWILFIAIAITQYEGEKSRSYLSTFVAGASVHAIFFYLGYFDVFHFLDSTVSDPAISGNRNTYGPLIAIAGISTAYLTLTSNGTVPQKLLGILLALALLISVLLNTSRTGHFILITLAVSSIAYVATLKNKKLLGIISLGILLSAIFISAQFIDSVEKRVDQAVNAIQLYKNNPLTSTGVRISFYQNTIDLQLKRSLLKKIIGSGVGDYVDEFNEFINTKKKIFPGLRENKDDIEGWNRFRDLHSQFLMNLLKFGYLGIILILTFILIFYSQAKKTKELVLTGFFVSVFLALMVNSLSQSAMETRGLAPTYFLILGILFSGLNREKKTHE